MRKINSKLAAFLCAILVIASVAPANIFAEDGAPSSSPSPAQPVEQPETQPSYNGSVTFVGQWTDESSRKQDTVRQFQSGEDVLGDPVPNSGLYRGAAKTFLGWSNQPQVGNGGIAEGAKLFSKSEPVKKAFPKGIPADAKLYGIYFSLNDPEKPFELTPNILEEIKNNILEFPLNNNNVSINKNLTPEEILPSSNINNSTDENNKLTIIEKFVESDFASRLNEVVLTSEFKMNNAISLIAYKNPGLGYGGNHVFTGNYASLREAGNDFAINPEEGKGYTYVDLKVNLDERFTVPEKLYLEFKGYAWRPLFVLGDGEKLNIIDPNTDINLGNTKNSFDTLVSNNDPRTTFAVETKGHHNIVLRMIIRVDNEVIAENNVVTNEDQTVMDVISQNMTLRVLTAKELEAKGKVDAKTSVVTISKEVAKALAGTNGKDTIAVTGSVEGVIKLNMGGFDQLDIPDQKIEAVAANEFSIGYIMEDKIDESKEDSKDEPKEDSKEKPKKDNGKKPNKPSRVKTADERDFAALGFVFMGSVVALGLGLRKRSK